MISVVSFLLNCMLCPILFHEERKCYRVSEDLSMWYRVDTHNVTTHCLVLAILRNYNKESGENSF